MEAIRTARLVLRPTVPSDLASLARILSEPEVAARWPDYTEPRIRDELTGPTEGKSVLAIEQAGRMIGAIQFYENQVPEYRHGGLDLFLERSSWGHGHGTEAIRAVSAHLMEVLGHHRVVADPAADNSRAIRSLEKAGFRRVGVMRRYERGRYGTWHDGLLMDLLAHDLSL